MKTRSSVFKKFFNSAGEMKTSSSVAESSYTSYKTLASDSESSNPTENKRLNPSGPSETLLVEESSSELNVPISSVCESSSSLPPSQVNIFTEFGESSSSLPPS